MSYRKGLKADVVGEEDEGAGDCLDSELSDVESAHVDGTSLWRSRVWEGCGSIRYGWTENAFSSEDGFCVVRKEYPSCGKTVRSSSRTCVSVRIIRFGRFARKRWERTVEKE